MSKNNLHGRGLRILLFGMPGSGKTSLLGALWQAGQSQEPILGSKISNPSGGLAELHEAVYGHQPAKPAGELAGIRCP